MKLEIEKYFSEKGVYDSIKWEKTDVTICDEEGKKLFIQKNVEAPSFWSQLARQIVASRYFYGENGTQERESSVKQLIERVSDTFGKWGLQKGYFNAENAKTFRDEISYITLNQMMAFNSPVWFNVGIDRYLKENRKIEEKRAYVIHNNQVAPIPIGEEYKFPQTSACFIQSVDDTMESIMQLSINEAMLFKYGSGTGTDLSTLRSSREKLSGGGKPSGPLAYLQFYDRVAGIVKSGGKTRRAAKMNSLRPEHPDILEFIIAKQEEQKKLEILMDNGLIFKEAESTVAYQNVNLSIRVTDAFMKAVENDEEWQTIPVHNKELRDKMPRYKARELFRKIAEGTYYCGDPGVQYHDIINRWHTCPNSAPINASNPCSEYMFVNNSSCNLASLNLMRFINKDSFDVEKFSKAVKLTAIAQDLEFDNSSFPTEKIAENSHKFRPLGMGYANLGSLVMSLGLPYDSDESRNVAASITALLTGKVYETSTEMAEKLGTFEEFEKNKEPMLNVMRMHSEALKNIDRTRLPKGLESILDEAEKTWKNVIERGSKYGFRNAQATVLAPTGTIAYMMNCDTTGIEAEAWLVKTKKLSEGGTIKIVNNTVKVALQNLGYSQENIKSILKYIEENDTIEGSELKEEHIPIFDCTYKPLKGKRSIHYSGQLRMMAAVQPFLSGAISKTVGLQKDVDIEEIKSIYSDAWRMGLKAVALYRDGSKRWQPLTNTKNLEEKATEGKPIRRKLPTTANSIRHKFDVALHEGYLHIGLYEDGNPGEIFINMSKEGSTIGGFADAFATSISFNLQHGVSLETLVKKFKHQNFEPRGLIKEGHPDIHVATSIVDYIFTYLEKQFLNGKKENDNMNELVKTQIVNNNTFDEVPGGFCITCATQMIKKGHCTEICPKCGWINPKGCGE